MAKPQKVALQLLEIFTWEVSIQILVYRCMPLTVNEKMPTYKVR